MDRAAGPGLRPYANSVRIDTDVECYCNTVATWTNSVDNRWEDLPGWLSDVRPNYWPDLDSMPISNNQGQGIQDGSEAGRCGALPGGGGRRGFGRWAAWFRARPLRGLMRVG